ncbi:MAG TPA: alcohol dehydrogenase catalytic domain-containing protein [Gemmatimonadota bacterium]|nr:alcohol dehydrogenase catalytic domain-containing protein [Gemmatimonadota bacterium]
MRAVVKVDTRPGPDGTAVREVPLPVPGPGQVRLKVRAAAICGSDRHIWHWDPSVRHLVRPPRIYGHEFCGEVDELGPDPGRTDLSPGDYVSAEMHVVCGICRQCRAGQGHICRNTRILGFHDDGSFAEFVVVPAQNVVRLDPRVVPLKVGAFLDALGNAVHTVQDHELAGARVAVLGYGPIGAMAAAIAKHEGAARIYVLDVSRQAFERAEDWRARENAESITVLETGGDRTPEVDRRILEETEGGVDLVLEMSGAEAAINQGLRIARMGGTLSLLGIPGRQAITIEDFARDFIFKGLTFQAIIGRRMFSTWERMLELLADGLDVASLVSHEYESLDAFEEGMRAFDAHEALKVVFYPHGNGGPVDTAPGGK